MPRSIGTLTLPVLTALPTSAVAGQQVLYQGVPWSFDGTKWTQVGLEAFSVLTGTTTIDVGALPTPEFITTFVDARATSGARVDGWLSSTVPAGKDADEVEMDVIDVWCRISAAGQITIRLTGMTGFIADKFTIDYMIVKG
jgi:hypothetical protein